jgi:hypothetical protein
VLFLDKALIRGFVQEPVELPGIGKAQLEEPALAHRVGIDLCRVAGECVIDLGDLSGDRRIDLARRLDRFDDGGLLAPLDPPADFGQLDIDNIAELRLRVVGDADGGEIAVEPDPFMILGETELGHPGLLSMND